jgi:hypothetical protein
MRPIGIFLGIILIMLGLIWTAQEYNLIPGSFLFELIPYAHRGPLAIIGGLMLMVMIANSTPKRP